MKNNLILSVVLSLLFTGGVFAQSGSKSYGGSSSKTAGSSSRNLSKTDREMVRAKEKLVSRMTRKDFEDVRLNRDQKQNLMKLVDSKYPMIVKLDMQIAGSIPAEKVKALQRAFRAAKKEGSTEIEAMSASMQTIGLSETVQEKVLMMNESKETVLESIRTSLAQSFDQEQQQAFAASMAAKKEMMGEKEMAKEEMAKEEMGEKEMADKKMMDKEMTGQKEMMDKEMTEKPMSDEKKAMMEKQMKAKEMAAKMGSGSK